MLTWSIEPDAYDKVVKYFLADNEKIPKGLGRSGGEVGSGHDRERVARCQRRVHPLGLGGTRVLPIFFQEAPGLG